MSFHSIVTVLVISWAMFNSLTADQHLDLYPLLCTNRNCVIVGTLKPVCVWGGGAKCLDNTAIHVHYIQLCCFML